MNMIGKLILLPWFITMCSALVSSKSIAKASMKKSVKPKIRNKTVPVVPTKQGAAHGRVTIKDPFAIYRNTTTLGDSPMSASVPFLPRPVMLDGTLPGDRGFDPFNFSYDADNLQWYRTAEVKHARLAMLAAVGWPILELLHVKLAFLQDLKPLLLHQDVVLNDEADRTIGAHWDILISVVFVIESIEILRESDAALTGIPNTPGNLGFDPLRLSLGKSMKERMYNAEAELFNGRLAMLAVMVYAFEAL
jgi:Chlorophyll A-B binding protein